MTARTPPREAKTRANLSFGVGSLGPLPEELDPNEMAPTATSTPGNPGTSRVGPAAEDLSLIHI